MEHYLTYSNAAKWLTERGLEVSKRYVERLVAKGQIVPHRVSRRIVLVHVSELRKLLPDQQ